MNFCTHGASWIGSQCFSSQRQIDGSRGNRIERKAAEVAPACRWNERGLMLFGKNSQGTADRREACEENGTDGGSWIFCDNFIENKKALFENKLAIAYFDEFPVSKGHILIVTKRHAPTFFDITEEEQIAILELLNKCKKYLDEKFSPTGYNIGLNCGRDAGQSVMHIHMHLIPRYSGDVKDPRGGVRGVIPDKKNY